MEKLRIDSAVKIQQQWKETITNPKYNICRKIEFYFCKMEEENERLYAQEFMPDEPHLWCEACIIGICDEH